MTFVVRLLIVEDDKTETQAWEQTIEMHNAQPETHGFTIEPSYAKSLEDAIDNISRQDFDAAVVDIRLEQAGINGPNGDGNDVVEKLLDSELAVVAVFSGETTLVSIPAWAKSIVQPFRKGADDGEGTPAVMAWLVQKAPLIQSIRQAQLTIKKEMVRLFTRSIWPRWSHWMEKTGTSENLETALSRHLASHVHAALLENSQQKVHPEEWYFIPPIRDGIRTGDLVRKADGSLEVVITPRCDLANPGKIETIQLAECRDVSAEWQPLVDDVAQKQTALDSNTNPNNAEGLEKAIKRSLSSLRKFTQHTDNKASVHFLPAMKLHNGTSLGPFLVQFDKIRSIPNTAADEIAGIKEKRVASLTPEFLPSLIERLGAFFSRIGTPDYSHSD